MIDLSIIVPVYNVKNYIEKCIDSLLELKNIKKQIICIEDASTDGTNILLNDRYKNVKDVEIYINEKNSGLAYSRNIGLKYANGKYVMFVDSDDYINALNIEYFVDKMNKESLQLLYFDVQEIWDNNCQYNAFNINNKRKRKGNYTINTGPQVFNTMINNDEMFGCVWDCIYQKDFLKKNSIDFINGILHEDIPFTFKSMLYAEKVYVVHQVGYYYRQRNNSILHKDNYLERAQGLIIDYFEMMIVWKTMSHKAQIIEIQDNIEKYIDSIVSMMKNNLKKVNQEMYYTDLIINNFFSNFSINNYKKFQKMYSSGFIFELSKYKSIGFYGAGEVAQEIIPFLIDSHVNISHILVSNLKKNIKNICGIRVVEFCEDNKNKYDAIIIGTLNYKDVIIQHIKEIGYEGKVIELPM